MNHRDKWMRESTEYESVAMPIALYCSYSDCQMLIHPGEPVKKFDGCTYVHITCPKIPMRHFAAHKQPDTGMKIS